MLDPSRPLRPVHEAAAPPRPARELTVRAVVVAVLVAALMGAAEPAVVLRIGYGPNMSLVSAFLGFIAISLVGLATGVRGTRFENNLVQTAGTAAGSGVGFMSVVLAAIDLLNQRGLMDLHLSTWQIFSWLAPSGLLGVLLSVPLRKHYIDQENLTFADGTAAGETLLVLDQGPREAGPRVAALAAGGGLSALLTFLREGPWAAIPSHFAFRFLVPQADALRLGTEVGVLSLGAGMLVGLRITLSMGLGMVLAWGVAPGPLHARGLVPELTFNAILQRWIMWPATGLMVAGGLAALALKWKVIAKTFQGLAAKDADGGDFPMRWVIWGSIASAVALAVVQKVSLGFPLWLTAVSLVLSLVLMLVGIRVLGETNWAPISAMANVMQAVFALLAPGHVPINMVGSGMSGAVAANGEHLMQDYRAGKIVGSTNRNLTWLQLVGVPVGALAVAIAYPALRDRYGVGGEGGLTSPISVKWAGFAELLAQGFGTLPRSALVALVIALFVGVALTLLEASRAARFVPSPTAIGLGMLIPGYAVFPMVVGGIAYALWKRFSPRTEDVYNVPLASGFITGEALVLLVLAVVSAARS